MGGASCLALRWRGAGILPLPFERILDAPQCLPRVLHRGDDGRVVPAHGPDYFFSRVMAIRNGSHSVFRDNVDRLDLPVGVRVLPGDVVEADLGLVLGGGLAVAGRMEEVEAVRGGGAW